MQISPHLPSPSLLPPEHLGLVEVLEGWGIGDRGSSWSMAALCPFDFHWGVISYQAMRAAVYVCRVL